MRGYYVPRKASWDTTACRSRSRSRKELGIRGREGIGPYGVESFVRRCIDSVFNAPGVERELTEKLAF
ncbi:MAG: hypothetical protein R3F62_13665 [Planctomycetota bacterium]